MLPQICNAKVAVKVGEPQTHCRITHSSLERAMMDEMLKNR
ncbi:hypothetical protein L914_20382 [Phytophthora nicotianae]|uniref:Uncharacterized protein n=1 Tax=Phytophthora nicotianae TaxID=4792 RepID=W2M764_PHYNI|nr:hypothetical protein L914_20382 [Phytophthora nicotianae]